MRERIARLHLGQLLILMAIPTWLGYGFLNAAADILLSVGSILLKQPPWRVGWWLLAVGILLIAGAHVLGRAWMRGKTLPWAASLLFSLFFPLVLGLWAWPAFSSARAVKASYWLRDYDPAVDTLPPTRMDYLMAYEKVAGGYGLFLLASLVVGILLLYLWFGERKPKLKATQ